MKINSFPILLILTFMWSCKTNSIFNSEFIDYRDGNVIYLKEGEYRLDKTIVLDSDVSLVGKNTVLILEDNFVYPAIHILGKNSISLRDFEIRGLELKDIRDKKTLTSYNSKYGIDIRNSSDILIENVMISNLVGTGIKVLDSKRLVFKDCVFRDIGLSTFRGVPYSSDGIYLGGYEYIEDITINKCSFINISDSFDPGFHPWPNDGDGIQILCQGIAKNIFIEDSNFNRCSARGVKIQSGTNVIVNNCVFSNGQSGVNMPMLNPVQDVTLSNNQFKNIKITFGTDKAGASMDATNIVIEHNIVDRCDHFFRSNGTSNLRSSKISNNIIDETERFVIAGRLFDTEISNNQVNDYGSKGDKSWNMAILINPESKDVLIEDNTFLQKEGKSRLIDDRSRKGIVLRNNKQNNRE